MNKALLDSDILSEIGKAKNPTVAANAKTYRGSFGHFTFSTVSVMEVVSGFQRTIGQPNTPLTLSGKLPYNKQNWKERSHDARRTQSERAH